MQMVAASKLRRAQAAAEAARPYAARMASVLANLAATLSGRADAPPMLGGTGKDQVHLLLVCTGDRGLSGAFNSSIARLARDRANALMAAGKEVKIFCVGRKGFDALRRNFSRQIIETVELRSVRQIGFAEADAIARKILALFAEGAFDVCTLFYAEFKSVISQVATARQIIPAEISGGDAVKAGAGGGAYEYEPDEEAILAELLPRNLSIQIFRALLENVASEQGAKMTAMDNATRNAGDMIDRYTLLYNRTRQAQITKELIEIISGAEAL
jgi:F-type H+-transporting ATPase subunit gamma